MIKTLKKFKDVINTLTFSVETSVHEIPINEFEHQEKIILNSMVNKSCTFGISTDVDVQIIDVHERNRKKLHRLELELKQLNDKMSSERYKRKTKPFRVANDLSKVCELNDNFVN